MISRRRKQTPRQQALYSQAHHLDLRAYILRNGCSAILGRHVDDHDMEEIYRALREADEAGKKAEALRDTADKPAKKKVA
jgi:hypothetical protein